MISQNTINTLEAIGDEFECELLMPPFNKGNNPFYCIKEIKNDHMKFFEFLMAVGNTRINFNWTKLEGEDKINYIEINETK